MNSFTNVLESLQGKLLSNVVIKTAVGSKTEKYNVVEVKNIGDVVHLIIVALDTMYMKDISMNCYIRLCDISSIVTQD